MSTRREPCLDHSSATSPLLGAMLEGVSLRELINCLPLSLVFKDLRGRRVFANRQYLEFHGKSAEEVLNKTDFELFPERVAQKFAEDDRRVLASGRILRDVEQVPSPGEGPRWIERLKGPARDSQGNVVGIQLLFWDVTKRVRAEAALEEERYLLHTLLANIPDAIYFKDRDSRILRLSNSMAKKFGLRGPQQAIGKTDADIFTEEHAAQARADELRIMETGAPLIGRVEKETWPHRPDTWCSSTKLPLRNSAGAVVGTFGISRDITELKRTQDELRRARDAADQANRAKGEFLANMSHEIRTPMNGILGMAELLSHTPLDAQQRDFVDLIRQSGGSLLRLLNDILDFSKIEAGRMELESVTFSLREHIAKTVQTLAVRAADKQIQLACHVDPRLPDTVIADPTRIRQVVVNLVGNAIKFTELGEVVVEVLPAAPPAADAPAAPFAPAAPPDRPDSAPPAARQESSPLPACRRPVQWVRVVVRDTGIGIPRDKLATIFEAFAQADSSTTRRFGGTGLGLSISTQLVKLMGGELGVQSEVGQGTTFSFSLPLRVSQVPSEDWAGGDEPPPGRLPEDLAIDRLDQPPREERRAAGRCDPRPQPHAAQALRILLAEDGHVNRRVAVEMLKMRGHQVTAAEDGWQAVELCRTNTFDLILMDLQMPRMDGFEATAAIRQLQAGWQRPTPIIAMTARAMRDDRQLCLEAGMDDYISKPVDAKELDRVLGCAIASRQAAAAPPPASIDELLSRFQDRPSAVQQLAESFCAECPQLIARMHRAVDDNDHRLLRRCAHTLKGTADLFEAGQLREICQRLESNSADENLRHADRLVHSLARAAQAAIGAIQTQLRVRAPV